MIRLSGNILEDFVRFVPGQILGCEYSIYLYRQTSISRTIIIYSYGVFHILLLLLLLSLLL